MIHKMLGIGKDESIGDVLSRHRGIGPGFDILRIVLAFYIFYGHAIWISGGTESVVGVNAVAGAANTAVGHQDGFTGWTRPFHVGAVPVFFALSGFLVVASAFRLRATTTFLAFRCLRIFPALVVETLLCAFLLGGLLTTLPVSQYFTDPMFFRYLGNMIGWVSFQLPSVFQDNPVHSVVNANLWTLPAEFHCYLITALLMISNIIYNRNVYTVLYGVVGISLLGSSVTTGYGVTFGLYSPTAIAFYFFTGILLYHWRFEIRAKWLWFLGAAFCSFGLLMFPLATYLAPIPVTYCIVFLGLVSFPKLPLIHRGDYSYGIYLYGFPITQALVHLFPDVFIGNRYATILVGGLVTVTFAAASWHMVEIHALKLKKKLPSRLFPKATPIISQQPVNRASKITETVVAP